MRNTKKAKKRRKLKTTVFGRRGRKNSKAMPTLPPNENLKKFPDETYGDMQLPFPRA